MRVPGTGRRGAASPALVLLLALVGISFAGPLTRLSHAHPLAIATWRLGFALLLIAAMLVGRGEWRQWRRLGAREIGLACGAGVLLALHFWSWNASITMTTVAASVVLVNTQPVIVALLSAFWLREVPGRRQWIGIAIAMLGALVVAGPDLVETGVAARRAALGNLLAVVGAITAAVYFVTGRRLRGTLDLWPYVGLVYGACFVALVVLSLAKGVKLSGQPPRELAIFAALAIGPMMLGHTGLNWALRYLPAYVVNLTLLGEPVGATIIAALLPGIREVPAGATLVGGALILLGVLSASRPAPQR